MKKIEVVAAILYRDGAYFATQRGYGEFEGMWESLVERLSPARALKLPLNERFKKN